MEQMKHTPGPWTAVFRSALSAIEGNPFRIDTPFGRAVHIGRGNAFHEADLLREERDELREALEPFAALLSELEARAYFGDKRPKDLPDSFPLLKALTSPTLGDLRRARSALSKARTP
jgi:hypothetical protein